MMDIMGEVMAALNWSLKVVVEIMNMHISVAEASPWSNVKIPYDLVDANPSFYTTSLFSLSI